MKRSLIVVLSIIMALVLLAGCNNEQKQEPDVETSAPAQDSEVAEEPAQDSEQEPVEVEEIKVEGWDPSDETDILTYDKLEETYGDIPVDSVTDGMRFGAILPEPSNEYWITVAAGIESKCEELGITPDIQFALNTEDQAGQLAAAETLAKKDCDAYIFSPLTVDLLTNLTEQLQAEGKPIINTYFPPLETADVFVGALDAEIAKMAAQKTIDELGGKGKVATAMGAVASRVNQVRCGLYKDYIEANSDIEVVAELPAEWVPETAMQMTQDLLTRTPDVDLIWCANDNLALGVIEGLRASGALGQTKVLSMDATSAALNAVKDGELFGTYSSTPFKVGELSVEMALRMIAGQDVARVIVGPAELVDASNVDQFLD